MDGRLLQRAIALVTKPLERRVKTMVLKVILEAIDDSSKAQSVKLTGLADTVREGVERFQEYGFTSVPEEGAEGVAVAVGGSNAHQVVVATEDRRYRPKNLAPGDVALYRLSDGVLVWLKANGMVELGLSPTQFVALANLVKTEIEKAVTYTTGVKTALQTGLSSVAAGDGGAAAFTAAISGFPAAPTIVSPAATKVKAK